MKTNLLSNLSNGLKKGTGLTQVGYRQGTGKVQAGEKQACGRKESLAWSQVELISDEGAIEHPLITHSAPFGIRWKPAGKKGSSRVWKHVAMIFAVLVMSMANVGMAWGQGVSYVCGFENGTDSWTKSSMGTLASEATEVRTGGKSLKCPCSNANGYARKSVTITKGYYTHYIVWAKSSASTNASLLIDGTATSKTTSIGTSGWTQITHSKQYTGSGTQSKNFDIKPGMASGNFFVDDVIIYYSSSSTTDVTAPSAATSASATTSSISWTCGSDAGTGVQATLIFHRTGGSVGGNDLTLNDQGIYSLTATEGPKVVGNWTLLSASVGAAATSYSGTFEAGHEYAIVHRDLAYNYSTPTYVTVAGGASCEVPSSVTVDGTWRRFPGETITLTATATGGVGTKTYQWQKYMVDTWTNLAGETSATFTKNCTKEDAGQYRCVVSTGATCSLASDGYNVRVYTLEGKYEGGSDVSNNITVTSGTTGTATVNLEAGRIYRFKVVDNVDKGYGNEGRILANVSGWNFWSDNANYAYLFTGPAGAYTFTVNTANADATPTPSVAVNVAYPEVSHPAEGYAYFESAGWGSVGLYMWYEGGGSYTSWDDAPLITNTVEICSKTYYYTPLIPDWYNRVIFRNKSASGQTGDITISDLASYSAKYVTSSNATWQPFSTYTITYAANGGGGSMSATSGICPDADQAITSNAFTAPTGCASFAHWTANVAVKVGGNTITAGDPIANGATIQNINSNITLTAVWKLAAPTITDNGDNTFSISGSMAGSSYYYTTNNSTPTTSSSLYSSAVDFSAGEANITAKAIAHKDGYVDSDVASQACVYHAADPCSEPTEVANEIARFFVPCGLSNATSGEPSAWAVTNENASTGDNTFTTNGFGGGSSNWYRNEASGLIYGKLSGNSSYIQLKLKSGDFQAGDVVTAYFNRNNATKTGLTLKTQGSSYAITPAATAAEVETSGSYTLVADAIEADGSIKLFRANSSSFVNRIIVTRPACTNVSITTQPTTPVAATVGSACSITGLVAAGTSPTYQWYTCNSDGSSATAINAAGTLSFTGYNTATLGLTPTAAGATYYKCEVSGSCGDPVTSSVVTVNATAAASQTALVANTLYEVPDMIPSGASLTTGDQFFDGLSANTKFELIGSASGSTTPKVNNNSSNDKTIDGITFDDGSMWFKGNASLTSNIPTTFGLSFIVPEGGGKLYLYFSGTSTNIKLAKSGETGSKPSCASGYGEVDVTAGTYYLYGTGTTAPYCFYGLKLCSKYAVTITPTYVTKATGAATAVHGKAYTATFTANTGYTLPSDATVTIGGTPQTKGAGYTWTISDGTATLTIPAANVTGAISISVTGVAAESYSITYHCNGAESGCPSNVAAAYTLPSPLPTGLTKDGYDFGGWFTDSECTVAAIAGAALTGNTDLYAKWTVHSASECITITHWGTSNATTEAWAGSIADENKYKLAQSGSGTSNNKSTDSNASICLYYATTMSIYDSPTTTTDFANVTSVSFKVKLYNASKKPTITVSVGSDSGETVTLSENTDNSTFKTYTVNFGTQLTGAVKFKNNGSGDSGYKVYLDDIEICTASMSSCTTPVIPALSDQGVCEGADIAVWDATPTNASTITGKGESIAYSWKKKGNDTELATTATFDLGSSATEAMAGTYVVTVTVSKAGYASSTASKEVELSVTEETEVTNITADKATVYPGNSVTLTATANTTVTWQWYTCTNAEGADESIISGATSASYTIASAGAAGTYYYKAKGTSSCGTGERVYTLTVSEASGGDCETEFWFAKAADLPEGATAATHITGTPSGSSSASYTATIDGNNYTITGQTGQKTGNVTIVVPEDYEGTLYAVVQGSSNRTITLSKGGVQVGQETPANSTWGVFTFDDLDAGTYNLVSSGNIGWGILALKLCSAVACSDPEVTASADNTTVCVGNSVTFTATDAHASATYQWQKLDGTWGNISGATASTYTIASVVAGDAGKYRVIASHDCNRTSNEVTLNVAAAPDFGSTVPASVSVMQTLALSINTVEATDAVNYIWYKSADAIWDAGDTEIGTTKNLIKAYADEAVGSPSYYIFCRASNSCGSTTSTPIAVNVTTYVEEDCATRGNEGEAEFEFDYGSAGQGSYSSTACWTMNSNSKFLTYTAPEGKYFKTAKVTIASSSESRASYNWSTDGGSTYTAVALTVNSTLTERTINLSAHGNVDKFQIGRNFNSTGSSNGTLYVSKICFEYIDACTATTVTPSESSVNYEMGGEWTDPTFTLSVAGTLTYSSSNEDIALVDDDGTVTFNGEAGTVTITASYAGGTISATEYCASSGSYTINVSCPGGAPKVVASGSVDMSGCNSSVTLLAKTQAGGDFADGTYQWFRNGTEIDGATSSSYTATQAGTYTVERTNTSGCTTPSTNSAIVTSETTEPEVERLVPFQYYHVNKTYSDQMKMRHLFAVKNSGKLDGKSFKLYVSRNGGAATDVTNSAALEVWSSADGRVDTVMVNLNELSGKYSENEEVVYTCKAIDCSGNVSEVYKNTITMRVIGATPTLALICSGSSKASGTRKKSELTVGGDFLTGYNVADLCQQTGSESFNSEEEWGLYTELKAEYIVTPVNGYAVFNKLNYEPFDILLLTDYPKADKSDAAATVLDDMAALCDYRPMLSFKTHMVKKSPSKWAEKGFTTSPVVTKSHGKLNLNIVCYAHPMFEAIKTGEDVYEDADNTSAPLVYTMLTGEGYESSKGMQGFEIAAAENFVTIGLTHYNATIAKNSPATGQATWTPGSDDRMLVTVAERQTNIEARFILFSLNCGAQSKLTDKGEKVVLKCLEYLLDTNPLHVADCSFTFDNGEGNERTPEQQAINCSTCPPAGDGKWSNPANWGPDYRLLPGEFTSVRIKKPVEVDMEHAHVMSVRIIEDGQITIPAGKALDVKSTIRRMDGTEISPTDVTDIHIGSASTGNGTLIFNNNDGDTKARVEMYSNAPADIANMSAATSIWQYIGTPHTDVANARSNYYGSWIYQYGSGGWEVIPNGGPLVAFRGYCITNENAPVIYDMEGTLAATTSQDITIPAGYTVIANSWVAPIDINAITDDDMEGISDKAVYFFNTGHDANGEEAGAPTQNATGDARWAAGTYVSVPIHSAPYTSGSDDHIPSMQGFYVWSTDAGTLHLDYDRHVRPSTDRSILSGRMHAPRRAAAESSEPNVLKIFARGSRYDDRLIVLEREDFTRQYESGWDGEAWGGSDLSPMVYITNEAGVDEAVSAIPEFEGTVITFKAGEDNDYHFDFIYDGEESLYLFDTENSTYTQIMTGESYYFSTDDKAPHSRFILTRRGPQIATGIEPTSDSSLKGRAKKLLIENKMYILLNGALYDATGKMVK